MHILHNWPKLSKRILNLSHNVCSPTYVLDMFTIIIEAGDSNKSGSLEMAKNQTKWRVADCLSG